MSSRRRILSLAALALPGIALGSNLLTRSKQARAAETDASPSPSPESESLKLIVGEVSVAAIAEALLGVAEQSQSPVPLKPGTQVQVEVDSKQQAHIAQLSNGKSIEIFPAARLKGESDQAKRRFLDDARNAARVGSKIRDLLIQQFPTQKSLFMQRQKAWARPFARKSIGWGRELAKAKLAGTSLTDNYGRAYLLQWAGATLSIKGKPSPPKLAGLPTAPSAPTLAAYEAYIETLVRTLVAST